MRPHDQSLQQRRLEFARAWWLALVLPALRTGRQGTWRQVRTASCTVVEIRTGRPRKVDADGELLAETPSRLRVLPRAVAVLVPSLPPERHA